MKEAFFIARKIQQSRGSTVIGPLLKLSVVATALGMALVILSITTGKGLQQAIEDKFRALEGDFTVQAYSLSRTEEWRPIALNDSLLDELENAPYVEAIYPVLKKAALVVNPNKDEFEGVQIQGITAGNFKYFVDQFETNSEPISGRYGCWISEVLASKLSLQKGDSAVLTLFKGSRNMPRLVNTYVFGTFRTGLDEWDSQNILMNEEDVRRLNGWAQDSVSAYVVHLNVPEERELLSAYWNALVPFDMQAHSVEQLHPAIFGWLALFDTNIVLVLSIVLIVAIANLITALLVLIIDRTRMIGTLKALGTNDGDILNIFLWLSMHILGRGLFFGNLIGLGLSALQAIFKWVKLDPSTYYISEAPVSFNLEWILGANLAFLVISFFILRIPVRWISRLNPIQSIRFD
jgi:lipoprotein-releasing system permease protein